MVAVSVEAFLTAPCAKAGITITGLGVGDSVATVWRSSDGEREPVQGYRRVAMNDSTYVEDWAVPLGRPVTYEVEVLSGPSGPSRVFSEPVTVDSVVGYVQDPLIPQSAIAITRRRRADGGPVLASRALAALEYAADVSVYKIMGSNKPMALFGQRMAASGVDFSMVTDAAEENTNLRRLFMTAGQILVRIPASWGGVESGACFLAVAKVVEHPLNAGSGGATTSWDLVGDITSAPAIKVLTATFTYGDVALLMSTYQQKQDLMAGKTYLDDLKSPLG